MRSIVKTLDIKKNFVIYKKEENQTLILKKEIVVKILYFVDN